MAKEFKQRKIKNDNKKYIKLSIVIILIIAVLSLVILIVVKTTKNKKNVNTTQNDKIQTQNESKNVLTNIFSDKLNEVKNDNNIIQNNTTINNEIIENVSDNNQTKTIRKFGNTDAVINGIQREMTIEQVQLLLGSPENVQTEQEITTDYIVQKYFYDEGRTEIDFVALYESEKYIVHRIKTSNTKAILSRELQVGCTADEVLAAYKEESILYKDTDLIVIGYKGEDPIYATSIKPKLYFKINNNFVTEVSISIGSES